jgi:probable HAF family extracellular repeat protein
MTSISTKPIKRLVLLPALMVAMLLLYASSATTQTTSGGYTVIDLGTLGGSISSARDINEAGQVVGFSYTASGRRAFLYSDGQMTELGTLGGSSSGATGINDAGQVVGTSTTGVGGEEHAFLYSNGQMTDLGTTLPDGACSDAVGINANGQVAGTYTLNCGQMPSYAYLYEDGQITNLGTLGGSYSDATDINDAGQVVGESGIAGGDGTGHAFLYSGGQMTDLGTIGDPSNGSQAQAINETGQVVGLLAPPYHAFLYSNSQMTDLGTLPGASSSIAYDINDAGQVIGDSSTADEMDAGFLYSAGQMKDLNTIIAAGSGWYLTAARAINNKGQIAAAGQKDGQVGRHALLLEPPGADTIAPTVKAVAPASGATGISRATDVVATFSEQMDKSTLSAGNFKLYKVTTKGTTEITNVTVTPSADGLKATLNPYGTSPTLLEKNITYQAVVTTGTKDLAANALDQSPKAKGSQPMKWSFKTGG